MLIQFIKFCVVGASGMAVDFGITFLGKEKLRLNKYVANSLGFISAASTNYVLNRLWTFHRPRSAAWPSNTCSLSAYRLSGC